MRAKILRRISILGLLAVIVGFLQLTGLASSIGAAAYAVVQNAGSALTQRSILNFTGAGVSCADDSLNSRTTCTVSGGGSGTINAGTVNQTAYYSGTTAISGTGPGTTGQCFVSNGSGSPPSFQNCPSGSGAIIYSGPSLTPSGTLFFPVGGGGLSSGTETNVDIESPAAATVSNFYVQLSAAPGIGNSLAFTWRKNAASTAITCTISGGSATTCHDIVDTVSFAQADLMDVQVVTTGVIAGALTIVMATQYGTTGGGGGGGGGTNRGTFASATTCNGSFSGGIYYSTDVSLIGQCNGSSYQWYYSGMAVANLPSNTVFTGRNMGTSTLTTNGVMDIGAPASASDNVRGQEVNLPATPYTIDACFSVQSGAAQFMSGNGLYETDGTKLLTWGPIIWSGGVPSLSVGQWNSVTSFSGAAFGPQGTTVLAGGDYCLRWFDDGTNNNFSLSKNGGFTWTLIFTQARTSWLTATKVGWQIDPANSLPANVTLTSWNQH